MSDRHFGGPVVPTGPFVVPVHKIEIKKKEFDGDDTQPINRDELRLIFDPNEVLGKQFSPTQKELTVEQEIERNVDSIIILE